MTTPAYLRWLAQQYERTERPAALESAKRLREIAAEIEETYAAMTRNNEQASQPIRDLAVGTDTAIARLRAAQQAQPTPEELAEIRRMAQTGGRSR